MLAICLGGSWYLLAFQAGGDHFYTVHVVNENLARFIEVPNFRPGHIKPFYYSFIYLAAGWFPWTLLLPFVVVSVWRNREKLSAPEHGALLFSICWAGVVVALVTLSSAKRSVYLMPAFPALAYISAWSVRQHLGDDLGRTAKFAFTTLTCLFGVAFCLSILILATPMETLYAWDRRWDFDLVRNAPLVEGLKTGRYMAAALLVAWIMSLLATIKVWRKTQPTLAIGLIACAVLILGASAGLFLIRHAGQIQTPQAFMKEVDKLVPDDATLFMVNSSYYPPGYYLNHPCVVTGDAAAMIQTPGAFALVTEKNLKHMPAAFRASFELVRKSHPYAADGKRALLLLQSR